jgi:hypothetical protein
MAEGFKDLIVKRADNKDGMAVGPSNSKFDYDLLPVTFQINSKQLPEVAGWQLDKQYVVKARLVGKRIREDVDESETDCTFEIVAAELAPATDTPATPAK